MEIWFYLEVALCMVILVDWLQVLWVGLGILRPWLAAKREPAASAKGLATQLPRISLSDIQKRKQTRLVSPPTDSAGTKDC